MSDYKSTETKPSKRHTWQFKQAEIVEILRRHLANTIAIPIGRSFVWLDQERAIVTLVIDQEL